MSNNASLISADISLAAWPSDVSSNTMLLPLTNALRGLESLLPYPLQAIILLTGSLLLWRLWKFTILPLFEPNQPKRLPYWIPCEISSSLPFLPASLTLIACR